MEERKILVTGATGGIGSAIARKLAEEKVALFLHYKEPDEGKAGLEKELQAVNKNVRFFKADLMKENDINRMMEEISKVGNVDILVHCVSLPITRMETVQRDWSDFQKHIDLQAKALLGILKKVIPGMKEKGRGKVISVVTEYALGKPPASIADYVTAKYALLGLSKCLAAEYGKFNITCNCVSPGISETSLTAGVPSKLKEIVASQTPLKRICRSEDVAGVVKFLCSHDSDFVNGENIVVNGGYLMR